MAGDGATGDADTVAEDLAGRGGEPAGSDNKDNKDLAATDPTLPATDPTLPAGEQPSSPGAVPGPGTVIDRYVVDRFLGAGGMGVVLLATDAELGREVVIKLLRPGLAAGADARERLIREAQAMAKVSHPNVVPIFDIGTHGDQVFLAMEYIDGGDLAQWLKGERSIDEIIGVFAGAARGLATAHDAGLVHRDFKPANVLVTRDGVAKVTDFGLARIDGVVDPATPAPASGSGAGLSFTRTGAIMGTPAYMPPEQFRGEPVDPRSDVFSFCVALHEAIYRTRPFSGTSLGEILDSILTGKRAPVAEPIKPPPRIAALIDAGLSADPDHRPRSMHAVVDALMPPRSKRGLAIATAVTGVALAALIVAGLMWKRAGAEPLELAAHSCEAGSQWIGETWNEKRAVNVREWFNAIDAKPYVSLFALRRVVVGLNKFRDRWTRIYRTSCQERSALWPRQRDCLINRERALSRTVFELRDHTAAVIDNPLSARVIPSPEICTTAESMAFLPRPPRPEILARAVEIEAEIVEVLRRGLTADVAGARTAIDRLLPEVEKLEDPTMESSIRTTRAQLAKSAGDPAALELYFEAVEAARLAHDITAQVSAHLAILELLTAELRFDEAERQLRYAETALKQVHGDELTAALIAKASARLNWQRGDRRTAMEDLMRAYHLEEDEIGKGDPISIETRLELNSKIAATEQWEKAADYYAKSFTLADKVFESDTMKTAPYLSDYANVLGNLGRFDEALALATRVEAVYAAALGNSPIVAAFRGLTAILHHKAGHSEQAYEMIDAAIAATDLALGPTSSLAVSNRTLRAKLLVRDGRLVEADRLLTALIGSDASQPASAIHLRTSLARVKIDRGLLGDGEVLLRANLEASSALPPSSIERHDIEIELARVERLAGRTGDARARIDAVMSALDAETAPALITIAGWQLAQLLPANERQRARELALEALALFGRPGSGNPKITARIDAWLKANPE